MNSRRTSALSTKSCWLWRSSSWSWRAWRALMLAAVFMPSGSGAVLERLAISRLASSLLKIVEAPLRSRTVRFRRGRFSPARSGRRFSGRRSSWRARSTSALTVASLGVVSRPGAPPVPGGMTNSGPLAASTINVRGCDQAGDFGVAKLFQQAEDVAIDGLAPEVVAVVEITAHADGADPRLEGGRVERDRASFAITEDADLGVASGFRRRLARSTRASTFWTS